MNKHCVSEILLEREFDMKTMITITPISLATKALLSLFFLIVETKK